MKKSNELLYKIIEFLQTDSDILCDHVSDDLEINIDYECSDIYDIVKHKFFGKSFEKIVKTTRDRIVVAIESYIKEENK